MKNLLTAAAFAMAATTAQAQDVDCATIGDIAAIIMDNRQAGISMSEQMSIARGTSLIETMVIEAYRAPRMSVPENRVEMIEDFRTTFELMCYEAMGAGA